MKHKTPKPKKEREKWLYALKDLLMKFSSPQTVHTVSDTHWSPSCFSLNQSQNSRKTLQVIQSHRVHCYLWSMGWASWPGLGNTGVYGRLWDYEILTLLKGDALYYMSVGILPLDTHNRVKETRKPLISLYCIQDGLCPYCWCETIMPKQKCMTH